MLAACSTSEYIVLIDIKYASSCSGLIEFIQDDDRLRDERKKAKKTKDKYIGVASDAIMRGGSGGGGGG